MKKFLTLSGWARAVLMSACGVMAALALAPYFWWPILPVSFGLWLHYLLRAESPKAAFRLSWWWGFGFFLAGLYWVSISMTVDLARFGWMIPFALIGFNGALALFPASAGWVFSRLRGNEVVRWVLFATLVTTFEWLRGTILTGFPWNLLGYAWGATDASIQIASAIPIYPLSFLTLLFASSVALWAKRWPVLLSVAAFALMLSWAGEQLKDASEFQPPYSMRLVQANIPQTLKNDPAHARAAFEAHVGLSSGSDADYIIWSESALPFVLNLQMGFPAEAFDWLGENQTLITGAVTIDSGQIYNSIVALNRGGIIARYDKQHLVPFGEYVPFRGWLPIDKLTPGMADFERGQGNRTLLGFHPLICYEVIFADYAKGEKDVLLNLTNDGWFGDSSGPYQHLTMARFRAVEQGKPLIRVANSGVSAVIDAHGRVQEKIGLNQIGVIDLTSK